MCTHVHVPRPVLWQPQIKLEHAGVYMAAMQRGCVVALPCHLCGLTKHQSQLVVCFEKLGCAMHAQPCVLYSIVVASCHGHSCCLVVQYILALCAHL